MVLLGRTMAGCLLGAGMIWATHAKAAPVPLPAQGHFVVFDQPVSEALTRFCQATRLRCVIDPAISARVGQKFTAATPRIFLDRLTDEYHIDTYDDGSALYLTPGSQGAARSFALDDVPYALLVRRLHAADVWDDRFPVRADASGRAVSVFGPPRLIELVGQAIAGLKSPRPDTITIYRGSAMQKLTPP